MHTIKLVIDKSNMQNLVLPIGKICQEAYHNKKEQERHFFSR